MHAAAAVAQQRGQPPSSRQRYLRLRRHDGCMLELLELHAVLLQQSDDLLLGETHCVLAG